MIRYIKAAFVNRWNLLGLVAGIGFTFVSGHPEIGLPLVAAGELAWLGLVGTHPAFQNYIDIQENNARQAKMAVSAAERMRRILKTLPRGPAQRDAPVRRAAQYYSGLSIRASS